MGEGLIQCPNAGNVSKVSRAIEPDWMCQASMGEIYSNNICHYVREQGIQSYFHHWALQHTKSLQGIISQPLEWFF